jgi:tetratricopeptide (TPR) repeat protein
VTETGRPEPSFVQSVNAGEGFAYGAIGADIHVFGHGSPLYVLANWQPEPEADREWLREQPSRMLDARYAVVEFTGRDHDLAELHQWRRTGPRLAARWLHGPAGQGKTRLAAKFAGEVASDGWKVVTAVHGPGTIFPPPGSQDLYPGDAPGLLMIVDYADRWPLSHLTWLFSNAMLHQAGLQTRILLIARSANGWPAVQAALASHQAGMTTHFLEALPDEHGRAGMFAAARDSFAIQYDLDPTAGIDPPGPLDDPDMGLTLAVHMAALVAVDAYVHGQRPRLGLDGLTIYLLNREHLHWTNLYGDSTHELNPADRTFHTPPGMMNQAVFTAVLTGAVTRSAGTAILDDLKVGPDPSQVLTDHSVCYPPADSTRLTVLEPLYPDRLAEDFVALTLPGHSVGYPAQDSWAPHTATTLITRTDKGAPPAHLSRALIVLAAAGAQDRWRHVAAYLNRVLAKDPALAIEAGSAALTALAETVDISVLEAIEPLLPSGRHVDLDVGAAAVSAALTGYRLARTTDPGRQAALLYSYMWRLSNAGLLPQALAAAQEATDIYRSLAEANPISFLSDLAKSLNALAVLLSKLGRREEAVAPTRESVSIRRRQAEANPAADLAALAMALNNLGVRLSELGQHEEALTTAEECVNIYRRLADANPAEFLPNLAMALNNLGNHLSELGRAEDALATAQEATDLYQQLARTNPDAQLPDWAMALNNLGNHLSELGRQEDALLTAHQAVSIRRRLAEANPASFLPDLATSLNNLGNRQSALGRQEDALVTVHEAVSIRRRLAEANPAAHLPILATSLNNLGVLLSRAGRREEALAPAQEAVTIYQPLAKARPALLPGLAMSLNGLGNRLSELGRREEALAAAQEATDLYRQLARTCPDVHLTHLAVSLNNLGNRLSELRRREESLAVAEEAANIRRRLAEA